MTVLFTADTHFGDHRTLNIWRRPFPTVAEMEATLIARWNAAVSPDDEIWHLSDFARNPALAEGLLERLNGVKHLLRGNNDADAAVAARGWATTSNYVEIDLDDRKLVICHFPFRSWNGQHRGSINLHGHSHGRLKPMRQQFDVGVDAHGFAPVTLAELLSAISTSGDQH